MKLIPQERLDAAKGCTKGPWKFGVWDWQLSKSDFIERPLDYTGPGYYGNPSIYDADGKEVAGCDEYYVFSTPENVAAMLLAPELLAENEMLRAEVGRLEKLIRELYMWTDLADAGAADPVKTIRLLHDELYKEVAK